MQSFIPPQKFEQHLLLKDHAKVKTWICLSAYLWLARQVEGCGSEVDQAGSNLSKNFLFFAPNSSKFKRPPRVRQRSQTGLFYNRGNCLNAHLSKNMLTMLTTFKKVADSIWPLQTETRRYGPAYNCIDTYKQKESKLDWKRRGFDYIICGIRMKWISTPEWQIH